MRRVMDALEFPQHVETDNIYLFNFKILKNSEVLIELHTEVYVFLKRGGKKRVLPAFLSENVKIIHFSSSRKLFDTSFLPAFYMKHF